MPLMFVYACVCVCVFLRPRFCSAVHLAIAVTVPRGLNYHSFPVNPEILLSLAAKSLFLTLFYKWFNCALIFLLNVIGTFESIFMRLSSHFPKLYFTVLHYCNFLAI